MIFLIILLLMTILTLGIPLTVVIHHLPEPIIQQFSFFTSSMGSFIINDSSNDILRLLQGDIFLLLVMVWGMLFYTGALTRWLRSIYISGEALEQAFINDYLPFYHSVT